MASRVARCNPSQQPSGGDDRVKPGHDAFGSTRHDGFGGVGHHGIGGVGHDGFGGAGHDRFGSAGHDGFGGGGTFYTGRLTVSIVTSSVCATSPEN